MKTFLKDCLRRFRQLRCAHSFKLDDLQKTGESEDGHRRVKWACRKCGKVFFGHCGLDISPKHGPISLIAIACILSGCVAPAVRLDHSARLMARPDFPAARDAAPEWCRDALKTINRLEADLERK